MKKKDSSAQIIKSLEEKVARLEALVDKQAKYISELEQRIDSLLRNRFGTKSEKLSKSPQADMFAKESESKQPTPRKKRVPKNSSINYPDDLEIKETIVDLDNQLCNCGKQLDVIGKQVTDKINYIPAKFYIDRTIYLKRACSCGDSIKTAKALTSLLPIKIGDELLAQIIWLVDRQPCII